MYIVLLLSFLAIGYLLGRLQGVENAQIAGTPTEEVAGAALAGDSAAPVFVDVENGSLPVKGDPNAPVTIVEFSDFECPFCGQFYNDSYDQIVAEYIDTGKAKLYYRHLPLDFHPQARPAALASECANEQNKFWEYHDKLFESQAQFSAATTDTFVTWATEIGINGDQFRTCLETEKYAANVDKDATDAAAAQASGTPTFYINGQQLIGAMPFASFKAIIDQELEG